MCEVIENLPRVEFEKIFPAGELDDCLEMIGVEYGDPGHDWCPQAARLLLKEWREA